MKKRILIIEDEKHIAEGIKLNLTLQGYEAKVEGNGLSGLKTWREWKPDLLVLDLMLPGLDGHKVLQEIRKESAKAPILVLSAKDQARDKIKCLEDGVDDYISKPFDLEEFLLRVKRLLTQAEWYQDSKVAKEEIKLDDSISSFSFGSNTVDLLKLKAQTTNGNIQLTDQEVQVLKLFFSNISRPLTRAELLEKGWGYGADTSSRTVDNFIVRLRRYFEDDPKNPKHFLSVRSVGYVFEK